MQDLLIGSGISFVIDKTLVRGLDYYCHTVFEFKSESLGSQDTIIGGGRYDGLTKLLGGPDIPGVGWASGIERIMLLLDNIDKKNPLVQLITIDEQSKEYGLNLFISLRRLKIKTRYDHRTNVKKSLKHANEEKIKFAIIVGESEVKNNNYTLKNLFDGTQHIFSFEELLNFLKP